MNISPRSLLAAAIALSLAVPGAASADRRGEGYRDRGDRHDHRYQYRDRHYDRHEDRHITRYYHDDDDGEKLLLGLVVGGILGYAINNAQHGAGYDYSSRYYPQGVAGVAETDGYVDQAAAASCLQEREYQTTVVVGGRNVPAYGTACLQPDGSWKREPARIATY
ncbi:MAG: hypothetical protein R3F42_06810 [Pseudomonadota bacterium]